MWRTRSFRNYTTNQDGKILLDTQHPNIRTTKTCQLHNTTQHWWCELSYQHAQLVFLYFRNSKLTGISQSVMSTLMQEWSRYLIGIFWITLPRKCVYSTGRLHTFLVKNEIKGKYSAKFTTAKYCQMLPTLRTTVGRITKDRHTRGQTDRTVVWRKLIIMLTWNLCMNSKLWPHWLTVSWLLKPLPIAWLTSPGRPLQWEG